MKFWIDAQLPPALAPWLNNTFAVQALSIQRLGLRDASDERIFFAAREANAVVITKDQDFRPGFRSFIKSVRSTATSRLDNLR